MGLLNKRKENFFEVGKNSRGSGIIRNIAEPKNPPAAVHDTTKDQKTDFKEVKSALENTMDIIKDFSKSSNEINSFANTIAKRDALIDALTICSLTGLEPINNYNKGWFINTRNHTDKFLTDLKKFMNETSEANKSNSSE